MTLPNERKQPGNVHQIPGFTEGPEPPNRYPTAPEGDPAPSEPSRGDPPPVEPPRRDPPVPSVPGEPPPQIDDPPFAVPLPGEPPPSVDDPARGR